MSLRACPTALVALLAAVSACETHSDSQEPAAGAGVSNSTAAEGGASGSSFSGAGGSAGRGDAGGFGAGQGGSAGLVESDGGGGGGAGVGNNEGGRGGVSNGEGGAVSAGNGGGGASNGNGGGGGEVASAGAAGQPTTPSSCADPLATTDISHLEASEAFEPYAVSGQTATQIRRSIDQNRSTDFDAFTSWYVSWQFADCSGNGLAISVDITYQFPEWQRPAAASASLVTSWDRYVDALFCHEYGHAQNGLDAANEVYAALSEIHAAGDCNEQQRRAEAAFAAILSDYQARDVQYDEETKHGATMGAVFPPP